MEGPLLPSFVVLIRSVCLSTYAKRLITNEKLDNIDLDFASLG